MKLDPLVAQIIVAKTFEHFTTSDVRTTYLVLKNDSSLESTSVRRKIYSELLKLVKKGWLEKLIPKNKKGPTRFSKTALFDVEQIQLKTEDEPIEVIKDIDKKKEQLLSKLNIYKADLLLNMGESEAYKELYSELKEKFIQGPFAASNVNALLATWSEQIRPVVKESQDKNTWDQLSVQQWESKLYELVDQLDFARNKK